MKKNRRTIIISAAILLLLGGAAALLMLLPGGEDPNAEASPSPSTQQTGALIDETAETVESIDFSPAEGESFTIVIDEDSVHDMKVKTDVFPYSEVYLASTADFAFSQPAALIITESATSQQLSDFGLASPQLTWTVNRRDGTSATLELGTATLTGDYYYARVEGESTVYGVAANAGRALMKKEYEYYDTKLMQTYIDEESQEVTLTDTMTYLLIEIPNGHTFEFQRRNKEEVSSGDLTMSSYRMLQPFAAEASDYNLQEMMAEKIKTITPSKVLGPSSAGLSEYGLESPIRLIAEDSEGWSLSVMIGGTDPETGGRYLRVDGSDYVLLDTIGDYSFLDTDPMRLRSTLVWLEDVMGVSEVEFVMPGGKRVLELDISDTAERASLDGVEISPTNAKRLYMRALELTIDGIDENSPLGEPEYDITIKLKNGGSRNMKLYKINSRQYVIELDGEIDRFYTGVTKVQRLLEAFDIIDAGGEIPWS